MYINDLRGEGHAWATVTPMVVASVSIASYKKVLVLKKAVVIPKHEP